MEGTEVERDAILRRFEAWLDEALTREDPPDGIAAELLAEPQEDNQAPPGAGELYSMWAAVTALTQEIKLQGRSFKQLSETLAPVGDLVPRVDSVVKLYSDARAELRRDAETAAREEILDALIDMRDRLARGLGPARQYSEQAPEEPSWLDRLMPGSLKKAQQAREAVAALQTGYELSLARLDDLLGRFHVSEISCLESPFDPRLMSAVDTEETGRAAEGTVLEVYRAGYEWNGEIYRTAQVKVARAPKMKMESGT